MKKCHQCGEPWEGSPGSQPGKGEVCSKCGADLYCCLNCHLYDPFAPKQCTSRSTEPVKYKNKRNFCEEFRFSSKGQGQSGQAPKGDMESKWNDLFK